jgi:hypothetical protein
MGQIDLQGIRFWNALFLGGLQGNMLAELNFKHFMERDAIKKNYPLSIDKKFVTLHLVFSFSFFNCLFFHFSSKN